MCETYSPLPRLKLVVCTSDTCPCPLLNWNYSSRQRKLNPLVLQRPHQAGLLSPENWQLLSGKALASENTKQSSIYSDLATLVPKGIAPLSPINSGYCSSQEVPIDIWKTCRCAIVLQNDFRSFIFRNDIKKSWQMMLQKLQICIACQIFLELM